jgi:hypothetical protein
MSIRIDKNENGLSEICDETLEENGWVIVEQPDHTWALYDNVEWYILDPDKKPLKIYANHELGDAIQQGQKWT